MKNIEEKLWDYIDGSCTTDEHQAISLLIETDTVYKNKYNELLQLNNEFARMELDEPPMAFAFKIIETIRAEQAQKPLRATINSYVIKGIFAFFMLIITGLIIAFLANINSINTSGLTSNLLLPNFARLFDSRTLNIFLFFDTVLGLFLLDIYLRKQRLAKH